MCLGARVLFPSSLLLALGEQGESYNINADTVAGDIAAALQAEKLLFLTDVAGILDRDKKLLPTLNPDEIRTLKQDGVIDGGMLPKVDACLHALTHGVAKTHIIDGTCPACSVTGVVYGSGSGNRDCGATWLAGRGYRRKSALERTDTLDGGAAAYWPAQIRGLAFRGTQEDLHSTIPPSLLRLSYRVQRYPAR